MINLSSTASQSHHQEMAQLAFNAQQALQQQAQEHADATQRLQQEAVLHAQNMSNYISAKQASEQQEARIAFDK